MSRMTRAVFFDVDFTLIYPGPMFRGEGYRTVCAGYGIEADPEKFEAAVASAAALLDGPEEYDAGIFVTYISASLQNLDERRDRATVPWLDDEWAVHEPERDNRGNQEPATELGVASIQPLMTTHGVCRDPTK